MTLRISDSLSLPLDTVTDTIGVLAVKGAGKTYTFLVLVEEMAKHGLPVIVLDPVGVCWGLRSSADGLRPGLPVAILGGPEAIAEKRADVLLQGDAGVALADWVLAERRPAVFDLSELPTKAAMIRFTLDFLTRLYNAAKRAPIHIVLDEADEFAPQKPFGEETRMLRAVEVLVRRGRAKGLGVTMVTQRPAVLSKNILTQIGTLIVGRTLSPQDRKAVDEWVIANATAEQRNTFMKSLASLPTREKWVWSPQRDVFARVAIRARETFDSSATPKVGEVRVEPKALAPVDIDALRGRIAATIEQAKADDPQVLRGRIAELERQAEASKIWTEPQRIEIVPNWLTNRLETTDTEVALLEADLDRLRADVTRVKVAVIAMRSGIADEVKPKTNGLVTRTINGFEVRVDPTMPRDEVRVEQNGRELGRVKLAEAPATSSPASSEKLSTGERKILTVLAQHPSGRTKVQVAILTGYAHTGGGFSNYLSALRSRGLLDGGGDCLKVTPAGRAALGRFEPLPRGRDLLDYWKSHAGGKAERLILDELGRIAPSAIPKTALANRTGYVADGGGFNNALSRLRTLELVKGSRDIALSPTLAGGAS